MRPGEAMLDRQGYLATDSGADAAIAADVAAFRETGEAEQGITAQRRLGLERYRSLFWRAGS